VTNILLSTLTATASGDRLLRTFARARIRPGALAAHGKMAAVANASVTTDFREAFDVHRYLAAQITFHHVLAVDNLAQASHI
jgi:hypothetical protein